MKISLDPNDPSSHTPITVIEQFQECVAKYGNATALRVERDGQWLTWTYDQYFDECCRVAKSLIQIGLDRFGCTVIMGFNSPEWFFADIGTIFAGGIASGIYTTNGVESTHYIASHCKAQVRPITYYPIFLLYFPIFIPVFQHDAQSTRISSPFFHRSLLSKTTSKLPSFSSAEKISQISKSSCSGRAPFAVAFKVSCHGPIF